jgi:ubiquinone/menaquinone biosynthesis C-methylase UbiE
MLIRTAMRLTELSPMFRRLMWRQWYQYLAGYQIADWRFMNYGYEPIDAAEHRVVLEAPDEADRYSIQLYDRVARAIPLAGRDVLEVGCGRGGGSSFVQRYHHPRHMTGVDYSHKAVRICKRQYQAQGLSFVQGDAEALPFGDESFDAVLNVESSHCYGSVPAFLTQVRRVLRPGGHFSFVDLRTAVDRDKLHAQVEACGLTIVEQQEITPNVLAALRLDSPRKLAQIERHTAKRLAGKQVAGTVREFAAVEGSQVFQNFQNGTFVYLRYLLKKPN